MAIRKTRLITKNSIISGTTLPTGVDALRGEAVVNLSEGILFYSGAPSSPNFTPSNYDSGYFEVGSNLYDLRLRNKITQYQGLSGTSLDGQFLSGTSNGFVVAPISGITSLDTFTTGFTYTATTNTLYIYRNQNKPALPVTITEMSGLTINGNLTVTGNSNLNIISGSSLNITGNTVLSSFTGGTGLINGNITVTGNTDVNGKLNVTGDTTLAAITGNSLNITGNTIISSLTGGSTTINGTLNVTGDTILSSFTGGTGLINGNLTVTGNTNISGNTTIAGNLKITGLSPNLVVYTDNSGNLKTEAAFGYIESADTLSVGNVIIGSGGSISGSGTGDLTVHGNLTVFGQSISAFTSQLYVEDNNIYLNYNPTGTTSASSIGAGITIQSGEGSGNGVASFELRALNTLTGNTGNPSPSVPYANDYPSNDGYSNRGWITQLNDIVIRSSDITVPKGVRVLAEFDTLDGGTY